MFVPDLTLIGVTSQSIAFVVYSAAFSGSGIKKIKNDDGGGSGGGGGDGGGGGITITST